VGQEIDEGFLDRTYRTVAIVWAVGTAISWQIAGWAAAAGWTAGAALSAGVVRGFEILARRVFVPGAVEPMRDFGRFSIAKLAIVLSILVGVVLIAGRNAEAIIGFCAGLVLAQGVIIMKALGLLVVRR